MEIEKNGKNYLKVKRVNSCFEHNFTAVQHRFSTFYNTYF